MVNGAYIHCIDPLLSLTGRELPPFASDLGVFTPTVGGVGGDDSRHEEGKKENTSKTEEGTHL